MLGVLVFSLILLAITIGNYIRMQKVVSPNATCPNEAAEVENNWRWHKRFMWISCIGVAIGAIGCLIGYFFNLDIL